MLKLYFYVPESHKEPVKEACFAAGAGSIGDYSRCAWEILGTGQFLPGSESTPFLGTPGEIERESEYKVEMVLPDDRKESVIEAFKRAHPYEEPAYGLIRIET